MAEPDYSKSWYQRSGGNLPFSESLAAHLRKELGPNAEHRYEASNEATDKLFEQYANKYKTEDALKWPAADRFKYYSDLDNLENMFIRPHERELFTQLYDLEATDPMWEPETTERTLRQQYPDLVARMERGKVQPVQEPRAPVMQPKPPVMPPVRKAEPVQPPMKPPTQKPAQVTAPKAKPASMEQRMAGFLGGLEKEGYLKMPTQADVNKQIAQNRLRNMMQERELELRARDEVPVSLPEAVNPTGR
jgi:hypothetical protein